MTDRDEVFFENLDLIPPDDIVSSVNPFKKALNRILTGFALCAVTFNFIQLNYILPFVGMLLMLLGFRTLRRENKWFSACFTVTLVRFIYLCAALLINTTIHHTDIYASALMTVVSAINILLLFVLFALFGKALRTVQQNADLPKGAGGITALIIWHAILLILALSGISGTPIAVIMLTALAFIIYSLYKLSKELDEAGYTITPSPAKVPDWLLCSVICALLIFGGICGYHFFSSYTMDWQVQEVNEYEDVQAIKAHLSSLGFPEEILNDLSPADLLSCRDALSVEVKTQLHPVNDGRQVTEVYDTSPDGRQMKSIVHTTVYDQKELCITSAAVRLPAKRPVWKFFHHFSWKITPNFYGTECIRIMPAYNFNLAQGWSDAGEISGRILYNSDNTTYAAPYKYLGTQTYTADDMFFGQNTSTDIYATFSMPRHGANHRGYICYTTEENQPGWMLSSWISYTHRQDFFQYPNQSAIEETQKSFLDKSDAYKTVSDAIQFYPYETTPTE